MTIKKIPTYPPIAKNAAWQKQKSFKDRLKKVTKTGLGVKLEAAEKAFANIKFDKLDVNRLMKANGQRLLSQIGIDGARRAAQQHLDGPVTAAHTAVLAAASTASTVARNPALSTRAGLAADTIAVALRNFAIQIDPDNISLADFDAYKKELDVLADRSRVTVKRLLPAVGHAAEVVKDLPTVAGYSASGFQKQVLVVNTALTKSDDLTLKVWGEQNWAAFASPAFLPKQDGVVMKKVNQVLAAVKELEDFVGES